MGQLYDDLTKMIEAEREHQKRPPNAPNCRCTLSEQVQGANATTEAGVERYEQSIWPVAEAGGRQTLDGKPGEVFLIDVRPGECFLDGTQLYLALEANSSCLVAQNKLGRKRIYQGHRPGEIRVTLITQAQFLAAEEYIAKRSQEVVDSLNGVYGNSQNDFAPK